MSLFELLGERAKTLATVPAFTFVTGELSHTWTWGELHDRACGVAEKLAVDGVVPGDRVLLHFDEGLDFLAALFGCFRQGALAVPVQPMDRERQRRTGGRLRAIIRDATPKLVLGAPIGIGLPEPAPPQPGLAYLQYTSGSTADPKGVQISPANLMHQLRDFDHGYDHDGGCIVSWLPATHDLGLVYGRLMGLFKGLHTVFFSPAEFVRRPRLWLECITRYGGTHSPSPNFGYALAARRVVDLQGLDLSSMRVFLNGAEPIRSADERAFIERFAGVGLAPTALTHAMGMSEATAKICSEPIDRIPRFVWVDRQALADNRVQVVPADHPAAIEVASNGSTQFDTVARIIDPTTGEDLGEQGVGELWVSGQTVASGYWGKPDHPDFKGMLAGVAHLRTGDLGFLHQGELYLVGRLKDVLIVHGQNHHAPDLEQAVEDCHPAVRANGSAAFSLADETIVVVAEVAPTEPEPVFQAMRAALAEGGLAAKHLVLIEPRTLLKTSSGKLRRRATRTAFLQGSLSAWARWDHRQGEGGRSLLFDEAARLLGLPVFELPGDVPLKELGLDSVTAVELVERVGRAMGRDLPSSLLFDHPTLDALAQFLADDVDAMTEAEAEAALLAELEDL